MRRAWRAAAALLAGASVSLGAAPAAHAWDRTDTFPVPSTKGNIDLSVSPVNGSVGLNAKVLLPDGYAANPTKRYPALYLLNGAGENYTGWTDPNGGDAANLLKGLDAIVIMPEGGRGFYSDWWYGGKRQGSNWEQYLLDEVVPTMEAKYRILPGRSNHAIGGLSMGAYGAPYLAAKLPSYFGNVMSFSGLLDNQSLDTIFGFIMRKESADYDQVWGSSNGIYAAAHNPQNLASNLAKSRLYVYSGDGNANWNYGFLPDEWFLGGSIERSVKTQSVAFVNKVRAAGANVTTSFKGGVHAWRYWRPELPLYKAYNPFGAAPVQNTADNTSWTYKTMQQHGNAWGIGYKLEAAPNNVVTIRREGNRIRVEGVTGRIQLTSKAADSDASGNGAGCSGIATLPVEFDLPAGC
ncbi:MAG: hypothetical protein J7513_00985 [Solirubrobacteraceae bacterium]|nr:hypothetical protein [Solirubrobacteraceae bacterium]